MRLVDSLYAYIWQGSDNNCNTYVFAEVLNGSRHLVIDPGHITTPYYREPGLDRLLEEMEKDGIAGAGIGLVILTHAHPDHCEAAEAIREKTDALLALHEDEEPAYQKIGGKADLYLKEGTLELGEAKPVKLEIHHSPGHSRGHITLYWPDHKVLIAGDVIFYRSTGRADLAGGDAKVLAHSIQRLSQLDVEYLLCGHPYGHPGIIKGKEAVSSNFEYIKRNILY